MSVQGWAARMYEIDAMVSALAGVMGAARPDGSRKYTDTVLDALLAYSALAGGALEPSDLPPPARAHLGRALEAAHSSRQDDPVAVSAAVDRYFAEVGITPELLAELLAAAHGLQQEGQAVRLSVASRQAAALAPRTEQALDPDKPVVQATPGAQFRLRALGKKE